LETSSFKVTSCLLIFIKSLLSIKLSLLLFCLICSAESSRFSKLSYSFINNAAVFRPIPGAPGTLSELSPANA